MLVAVMGKFKGDYGYRMHLLTLLNVISSGISINMWLERLIVLPKKEGNNNYPVFCDMECYMLSASAIESMFHPILEEIQIYRDRNLAKSIPRGLNVR